MDKDGTMTDRMSDYIPPMQGVVGWRERAIMACGFNHTQFGTILCAAMDYHLLKGPRFNSRAVVTSDGFVMCGFTRANGEHHPGAFVGHLNEVLENCAGLIRHMKLQAHEAAELTSVLYQWLGRTPPRDFFNDRQLTVVKP